MRFLLVSIVNIGKSLSISVKITKNAKNIGVYIGCPKFLDFSKNKSPIIIKIAFLSVSELLVAFC